MTNAALSFYPLTFVADPPDIIIGRKDINSYAAFPEDGAELLKQLQAGSSSEEATKWYQERYGESLDIEDFLETLRDLQFLREKDEEEYPTIPAQSSTLLQWLGRAAFSPYAWILYITIFGYCLFLLFRLPYLRPGYRNFFFSPSLVVLEIGLFLGELPGVFFHESYHVLAGQRLGISSRLGIGRRLYFLVFETHLDGLWSVPRKARYLPFLAGMLADLLWFSLFTIIASLTYNPAHPFSFPGAFCLALAFATLLRFLWQFYFYLQTDIYYVFNNIFHCVDLQQTTWHYLWNRINRFLGRTHAMQNEEEWHPRDRQVARWYVFFFGAGYLFTLGTLFLVGIPAAIKIFGGMFTHILSHNTFDAGFWDSSIFLVLNTVQLAIVAGIFLREHRARRKAKRLTTAVEQDVA